MEVLSVNPRAPVIATVIAVPNPTPPSNEIYTGIALFGVIAISKMAAVVPKVGETTLNTFKNLVAAFEFTT